jgi:hypothetical protein
MVGCMAWEWCCCISKRRIVCGVWRLASVVLGLGSERLGVAFGTKRKVSLRMLLFLVAENYTLVS